jgi:hypothetical protein
VDAEDLDRATRLTETLLRRFAAPDDPIAHPRSFVDGKVLMDALGLKPGPQVGSLLVALREAQAVGEVRSREEALHLARKLLALPPDG